MLDRQWCYVCSSKIYIVGHTIYRKKTVPTFRNNCVHCFDANMDHILDQIENGELKNLVIDAVSRAAQRSLQLHTSTVC